MKPENGVALLRELAARYAAASAPAIQDPRRRMWKLTNSLERSRPPIYVRHFAWKEMPESTLVCEDPWHRAVEEDLKNRLFWFSLDDDSVFEPWFTVRAVYRRSGWGLKPTKTQTDPRGAWKEDNPIKDIKDLSGLVLPDHSIDEEATAALLERAHALFDGILEVNLDRGPAWRSHGAALSSDLGHLRGIEHLMLDMYDDPEALHALVSLMSRGVLNAHDRAEEMGDWGLCNHENQAMPYAKELPDPAPNAYGVPRKRLWCYMSAQEFNCVSPALHEEFLLRYQMPIIEKFGLCAYGCCEDLTNKIDMLRRIPNLRRIAVTPFADVARCAERIGTDYVISYRPSPSEMVGYGWDESRIRARLREDFSILEGSCFDITLKDVETVQNDRGRVRAWVAIAKEEIRRAGLG